MKKKAEEARWNHEKEKEITRCMWARENRSDVESELESKDAIEVGDDIIFSEEEDWEVVVTLVECRDPAAESTGGEQEVERHGDVPTLRKRAVNADAVGEQEAKWMRSPCPSEASPASSPPAMGTAG